MKHRILRAGISFAIVVIAYSAYALFAVPHIEPSAKTSGGRSASAADREAARTEVNQRYQKLFGSYFPADHWIHLNPKVLENEQAMLVLKDYNPLPDGRVELNPCVMIFFPKPREHGKPAPRDAIVLEAPEGAVLKFADGFNLSEAKVGRLEHGRLLGEIRIHSDMKQQGPADDLVITTRDVQLTQRRIWTQHDVEFRIGEHSGRGSELEIRMLPSKDNSDSNGLAIGGLQSFELARNVKMNMIMGNQGLLPGSKAKQPTKVADGNKPKPSTPMNITCQGPFHFDLVQNVASFERQVDVIRINPNGPSDQMTCELLSIFFESKEPPNKSKSAPVSKKPGGVNGLRPIRLEAEGNPVMVRSPSTGGQVRCQKLAYEIDSRKIRLESQDDRVMLFQEGNEVYAPAVEYQPSERPDGMPSVWAAGPGRFRATPKDKPTQVFEAHWNKELNLRRHEGVDILSLYGRPRLRSAGMGELTSDEIHLWLKESAPAVTSAAVTPVKDPGKMNVEPDRMMASGDVQISSQQLSGNTKRLEIWFTTTIAPAVARNSTPARGLNGGATGGTPKQDTNAPDKSFAKNRYELSGDLIRMQVETRDKAMKVADVTIDGNVKLIETVTAKPEEKPLAIRGTQLRLSDAQSPSSLVVVSGSPAHVEARGMTMRGNAIHLDRGANRLWIDGAGTMIMPVSKDLTQPAPTDGQQMTIEWQGKMLFDGQQANFESQVIGRGQGQLLRTEKLEVILKKKVSFSQSVQADQAGKAEIHKINASGGVFLENQTVEAARQVSRDRMQLQTLSIDQTTGDIYGQGPGWVTSVRVAGSSPLIASGPAVPLRPKQKDEGGLDFLRVDFARALEGNTVRREISFVGEVRTIYGRVATWWETINPDDPAGLRENDVLLTCDRLTITEMKSHVPGERAMELEAKGNALVEGRTFTARADRMAYAKAKELLVLEGTGRSDAQLWRQTTPGGPTSHAAARKILYWRNTNRVEVDSARFLDLNQLGKPGGR